MTTTAKLKKLRGRLKTQSNVKLKAIKKSLRNNRVKMSWSNRKQVKSSQTTRVNRSYTLRTHHRIPLLCYTSPWLWAVAVQASRHYNSQHYPEFLCPAPQRHQSQSMTPTTTPYCKTSLQNRHEPKLQKRALYTKPRAREEGSASRTTTVPSLSSTEIWQVTSLHYCVLYLSIYESILQSQASSVHYESWVCQASVWRIYRPASVSMDHLLCSDGAWSTGTGLSVPTLSQEQWEHNKWLWTVHVQRVALGNDETHINATPFHLFFHTRGISLTFDSFTFYQTLGLVHLKV